MTNVTLIYYYYQIELIKVYHYYGKVFSIFNIYDKVKGKKVNGNYMIMIINLITCQQKLWKQLWWQVDILTHIMNKLIKQ